MKRQKKEKPRLSPEEVSKMTQRCIGHFKATKSWACCAEWVNNAYRQLTGATAPKHFANMVVTKAKNLKKKQEKKT